VGGNLGGAWTKTTYNFSWGAGNSFAPSNDGWFNQSFGGVVGGFQVGQNWQFNHLVVGAETGLDGLGLSTTTTNPFEGLSGTMTTYNTSLNWIYSFTPRIGYAYQCYLFFVKLGVGFGRETSTLQTNQLDNLTPVTPGSFSQRQNLFGLDAGAGIDFAHKNYVFGVVYDHYDFGRNYFAGVTMPYNGYAVGYTINNPVNTIKVTADYKFKD